MNNQLKEISRKTENAKRYKKKLEESGEINYRMKLVKQMREGKLTHAEAMEKLNQFKNKR